jgi:hypothetical protein
LLRQIQGRLRDNQTFVSVALLPPNLVAFILLNQALVVRTVPLVNNQAEADAFGAAIADIPRQLENRRGFDCIPAQVVAIAREIVQSVDGGSIVLLAPHAMLHKVPWRTLLRSQGMTWAQLPYVTQFSPLFGPADREREAELPRSASALGYGQAGAAPNAVDLEDEARDFAAAFGPEGQFVGGARARNVATALRSDTTVLLSCHGEMTERNGRREFILRLADGGHSVQEILEEDVRAPLVILSACVSGAYEMAEGDYPVGAAPFLLLAGARFCICTRFRIDAHFARAYFPALAGLLHNGQALGLSFVSVLEAMELQGYDLWRHLSSVEVLGRGA